MRSEHYRLPVGPLVELGIAAEHDYALLAEPLRAKGERGADAEREPVAERSGRCLHAGNLVPIGMRSERVPPLEEAVQELLREEALRREHRVVRAGSVALAEDEAIARLRPRRRRIDAEDPVVEHPERIQRRGAALVVLLVA